VSQLKKGAVLNYVSIILTNIVGLGMTPFILNSLGKNQYGIYLTIGALAGTISLLDFGLNNTIVRFVAKYKAEKDRKGEENFLATTMLIYLVIAILVLIIGAIFYAYFDSYFLKMNPEEIRIAKTMFVILIFNLAITLPGGAFTGICSGYEEFVFPKTINIIRYLLRSATVVAVLLMGGDAISLVIIDTIFNLIIILVTAYFVFQKLKVKFKLHFLNKGFILEILKYSIWIFVFGLVGVFQWKAGHWVLGNISVPSVLAIYGIGITLGTYYGAFSSAISSVFLPRATQMSVNKASGEELTDMMIKIGRLSFIILMYIFLPLVQNFGNSILEAQNKLSFKAILYLCFMIIGTALGGFLARKYEAIGMMAGSVIGWLIVQNVMNFYYHRVIHLNIFRFFKELSHKIVFALIIVLAIGYGINYIPGEGWINFVIKGCVFTVVFAAIMYSLGMLDYEKELFKKPIVSVLKRK